MQQSSAVPWEVQVDASNPALAVAHAERPAILQLAAVIPESSAGSHVQSEHVWEGPQLHPVPVHFGPSAMLPTSPLGPSQVHNVWETREVTAECESGGGRETPP